MIILLTQSLFDEVDRCVNKTIILVKKASTGLSKEDVFLLYGHLKCYCAAKPIKAPTHHFNDLNVEMRVIVAHVFDEMQELIKEHRLDDPVALPVVHDGLLAAFCGETRQLRSHSLQLPYSHCARQ